MEQAGGCIGDAQSDGRFRIWDDPDRRRPQALVIELEEIMAYHFHIYHKSPPKRSSSASATNSSKLKTLSECSDHHGGGSFLSAGRGIDWPGRGCMLIDQC